MQRTVISALVIATMTTAASVQAAITLNGTTINSTTPLAAASIGRHGPAGQDGDPSGTRTDATGHTMIQGAMSAPRHVGWSNGSYLNGTYLNGADLNGPGMGDPGTGDHAAGTQGYQVLHIDIPDEKRGATTPKRGMGGPGQDMDPY